MKSKWKVSLSVLFLCFASCMQTDTASKHFSNVIKWHNQATAISNQGKPFQEFSKQEEQQMLECYRKALEEAKKTDIASLNRRYPGLGDHFQQEFIKGVELYLEAFRPDETDLKANSKAIAGQVLIDQWGDWYMAHLNEIRKK